MAAINFPSTGLIDNVTTFSANGLTWQWNGLAWQPIPTPGYVGSAGAGYTGSATGGISVSTGDLFIGSMLLGGM